MEGCEDGPAPPQRNNACSPATSYSHQSTATLTPSPHEETRAPHDLPRLHQLDSQQMSRYVNGLGTEQKLMIVSVFKSTVNVHRNSWPAFWEEGYFTPSRHVCLSFYSLLFTAKLTQGPFLGYSAVVILMQWIKYFTGIYFRPTC